jgi:hypothetical protein
MIARPLPVSAGARIPHGPPRLFYAPLRTGPQDVTPSPASATQFEVGSLSYSALNGLTLQNSPNSPGINWNRTGTKWDLLSNPAYAGKKIRVFGKFYPGGFVGSGTTTSVRFFYITLAGAGDQCGFTWRTVGGVISLHAFVNATLVNLGAVQAYEDLVFVLNTDLTTVSFYRNGVLQTTLPINRANLNIISLSNQISNQMTAYTALEIEMTAT